MSVKTVVVEGLGAVRFYKKSGSKGLRLRLGSGGEVRVSLPIWATYRQALSFVLDRRDWIDKHRVVSVPYRHGMRVGKAHRLIILPCAVSRVRTAVSGNEVRVDFPKHLSDQHESVQAAVRRAAIKALKSEGAKLLDLRVRALANQHGLGFNNLSFRYLKSRWGSCSQSGDLTLNICLMHLPWELIDYVLLHELTHTKVLRHGPIFWQTLAKFMPNYKALRTQIRTHKPVLAVT